MVICVAIIFFCNYNVLTKVFPTETGKRTDILKTYVDIKANSRINNILTLDEGKVEKAMNRWI